MTALTHNYTDEQLAELEEAREIGKGIISGIEWALKMARGEAPRAEKSFNEWINEWVQIAEDIDDETNNIVRN